LLIGIKFMKKNGEAGSSQDRIKELENENSLLKARVEFLELFNEYSNSWEDFRDPTGKLIYLSQLFENITGFNRNDFLTGEKKLIDIAYPADIEKLKKVYQIQFERQPVNDFNFRLLDKNNNVKCISVKSCPVFNQKGEFIGTRVSCNDITKLRQIEDALKESEIKLKTIFNNSGDGIVLIDDKGIIVDWNTQIEKVTGLTKADAVNEFIWDIQYRFIAEDQKKLISADFLKQAWVKEVFNLESDQSASGYGEIVSAAGKEEYVEDLVRPVIIGDKRYYYIFQHYLTEPRSNE
jgi:PAS domain S-box-containing protein